MTSQSFDDLSWKWDIRSRLLADWIIYFKENIPGTPRKFPVLRGRGASSGTATAFLTPININPHYWVFNLFSPPHLSPLTRGAVNFLDHWKKVKWGVPGARWFRIRMMLIQNPRRYPLPHHPLIVKLISLSVPACRQDRSGCWERAVHANWAGCA